MKLKTLVKSYRTPFDAKAHAWGLSQWFNDEKPMDGFEALKFKSSLWD